MLNIFTTVYTVPDNIFKMPRKTLFSVAWLSQTDSNGQRIGEWCTEGSDGYSGDCKFCDKNIKIGNKGKMSLLKHSSSSRHIDAVKNSIDPNQAKLFAKSSQLPKQPTVHNQPGTWTNFSL